MTLLTIRINGLQKDQVHLGVELENHKSTTSCQCLKLFSPTVLNVYSFLAFPSYLILEQTSSELNLPVVLTVVM